MRKSPWVTMFVLLFVFGTLFVFMMGASTIRLFGGKSGVAHLSGKPKVLHMELQGVILDGKKFIKQLIKYRKDSHVKAVVIEVNSPGGVVGPSQEIYEEIRATREMGKPVVVVSTGLMASGAYYAAVASDHIMVAPGTLMGSIGVIIEFTNLEKLYNWAKISRFSITTGKYKDSGAEYRSMRNDERELFQAMLNEVHQQFKDAVAEGRKMPSEKLARYADGRVFTGAQGVQLGFADSLGGVRQAFDKAAELANLGKDFEVFSIPKFRPGLLEILSGGEESEEDWSTEVSLPRFLGIQKAGSPEAWIQKNLLKAELVNRPLYLMPGTW